jgi:hypothetical protein
LALVNEQHRWVVVSAPVLLTINERQSERSVVYLAASCEAHAISPQPTSTSPG